MDIDYLIDRLEALLTNGKRVPLSNKVMVDEHDCLDLIDQMRTVVPEEVKAAKRTLLERERIFREAEEDAHKLVKQAHQERDHLLSREGLLAEAERRRDEIVNQATEEALEIRSRAQDLYDQAVMQSQEMREEANSYTMQVLEEIENLLGKHLTMVRNGLGNFQFQANEYQQQMSDFQRQQRHNYNPKGTNQPSNPPPLRTMGAKPMPETHPLTPYSGRNPAATPTNSPGQTRQSPSMPEETPVLGPFEESGLLDPDPPTGSTPRRSGLPGLGSSRPSPRN